MYRIFVRILYFQWLNTLGKFESGGEKRVHLKAGGRNAALSLAVSPRFIGGGRR